ncbi:SH3 domain-containing protein [Candidatus Haliotispira prima]|uniref:SH3 domain-containing protein n=1 Tax=Candidatus Haliotispira prima TaxID=3034016 RepID=A0ABY8MM27_9SPIO|nr:SH3 domain-containing protein [Candidatus Haliotispira prima]
MIPSSKTFHTTPDQLPEGRFIRQLLLLLLLSTFISSCSNDLGYGVVLWSSPSVQSMKGLHNGQIIVIIGESKVTDSYIASFRKTEYILPTGRIAFFRHLSNAKKFRNHFMQYQDWYATNMNPNSLVMRAEPNRTSEQVYRLRPKQTVKILDQASDQITLGNIEGRWYEILTDDGIHGFTFDYYLHIEDHSKEATEQLIKLAAFEQKRDELKINLKNLNGFWYQKKYSQHLRSGNNIDLRILMLPHGQLYLNRKQNQIELYLENSQQPSLNLAYDPEKIETKASAELSFNDGNVRATFAKIDDILLYFRDQDEKELIWELQKISKEELQLYRKQALTQRKIALSFILQKGRRFSAAELYGTIHFRANGQFSWSNTEALVKEEILQDGPTEGTLYFPYRLGFTLQDDYDQLLTFVFQDDQELTFLLKVDTEGNVLLRYVPPLTIDETGTLSNDSFDKKFEMRMTLEEKSLIPVDLF